ncbi:hypothetical protein JXB31_03915 [Candidatus Woesearchaeota archaeon]|nr:hypothetical protein [Candidatus Woesearchaeota archaeon]
MKSSSVTVGLNSAGLNITGLNTTTKGLNAAGLKSAFLKIKEEMDDYRETINQNTNEIQGNYEYICRLDSKIEKLAERMDEITLFIEQLSGRQRSEDKFTVSALTSKEQEVFMAIYLLNEAGYKDIARRTGLTENLVVCYVTNLITKGVPLIKKYVANEVRLAIDNEFKQVQAKENILKINENISQAVMV